VPVAPGWAEWMIVMSLALALVIAVICMVLLLTGP
jgi:hypothetical protein